MQFLKDLNTFHIDGKEIPCIVAPGAPDDHYPGAPGVLYMDSCTGKLYLCTDANTIQKRYSWHIVGDVDATKVRQAVESYFAQNTTSAAGLTPEEKGLMLALFKAVPYQTDVSATMKSLETIWNSGAGGDEGGDAPGVTYYAVTYNLTGVTADNSPASIIKGGSLTVNLTPDTNAVLGEVTVTMGGLDVTASVYSNGKISISSVTGDVVITATATAASYTQVEYLQGDGTSEGAWMNTGYSPTVTDLVEVTYASTKPDWDYVFSSYNAARGALYNFVTRVPYTSATSTGFTRRSSTHASTNNDRVMFEGAVNTIYTLKETEVGTASLYDTDGNVLLTMNDPNVSTFTEPTNPILLFCQSNGTTPYGNDRKAVRIYSFKIKDIYGNTKLDLIPVLDENNVACMYDKVSGNFIYDATGNNTLIAGGAV